MKTKRKETECPCGAYNYEIIWTTEEKDGAGYCPFCGTIEEEEVIIKDEESDDE